MSDTKPIPSDSRERSITASAGQTVFGVPFHFQQNGDLSIFRAPSAGQLSIRLTLGVDYTVSGAGAVNGGSITTAPQIAGAIIRILGLAPASRQTGVTRGGRYNPTALDEDLDRAAIRDMEQRRDIDAVTERVSLIDGEAAINASLVAQNAAGTAISKADEARLAAEQAALYEGPWLDSVAALKADTLLTYSPGSPSSVAAGDFIQTRDGFSFKVLATGASVYDLTNSGSAGVVKLEAVVGQDGLIGVAQLGLASTGGATATAITNGRLSRLDFDFIDPSATRQFSAPAIIDPRAFRVNGVRLWSNDQAGAFAQVPDVFPVRPLFGARFNGFGNVETDFDVASVYHPAVLYGSDVKIYYIDPIHGTSGGAGTEADPMDRPSRATSAEASSPSSQLSVLLAVAPGRYDQSGVPWAFSAGLVKPYGIVPWRSNGRIKLLQGWWGDSRTWTNDGGGVYSSPVTNCLSVFDERYRNDLGDAFFLMKVSTVGALAAGTWMQDGGTVRVHLADGRSPDGFVGLGRLLNSIIADGLRHQTIYTENCDFLGGATTTQMRATAAYNVDFVTKNCRWMFSGGNGMELYGHRLAIHQNGLAAYNLLDGFNYHSDSATLTRQGLGVEINSRGYRNGYGWSSSVDINNGSTAHDRCIMMRYGTIAFENAGPNIVDVNSVNSYNFGCAARDSRRAGPHPDKSDYNFSDIGGTGTKAWLDCCAAPPSASQYSITAGADVKIRRSQLHPSIYGVGRISGW